MRMLSLLLLTLATSAWSADAGDAAAREQFTLKDGRVLVGAYDEATQTLTIESPKASMHVDQRDIVTRAEAPPRVEPVAKPKAEARTEAKSEAATPAYAAGLAKLFDAATAAHEQARLASEAAQKADQESRQAWTEAAQTFIESADLSPITVVVPQNPSQDDLRVAREKTAFNDTLAKIAIDKKDPTRRSAHSHLLGRVDGPRDFFARYGEWKGVPWVAELLGRRAP